MATRAIKGRRLESLDAHALYIGRVVIASNDCHAALNYLLTTVFMEKHVGILALPLWHAVGGSDRAQRDLSLASLKVLLEGKPALIRRIEWAINAAGRLSELRNDLVHLPVFRRLSLNRKVEAIPDFIAGRPSRVDRLGRIDTARLHRYVVSDFKLITAVLRNCRWRVVRSSSRPLPKTPQLQALAFAQQAVTQGGQTAQIPSKKPPPRS